MKHFFKRLLEKVVAIVALAVIGGIFFGMHKLLQLVFSLKLKEIAPYTFVVTLVGCCIVSLLADLLSWAYRKARDKKGDNQKKKSKKEDDDEEEDDLL